MGRKRNNMPKRKSKGGGKGSCHGGLKSMTAGGREAKRLKKFAERVSKERDATLAELEEAKRLSKDLLDSGGERVSKRQRKKLKRILKQRGGASPDERAGGIGLVSLPPALWHGAVPSADAEPSTNLKQLRKSLGIILRGCACPAPVGSATSPELPPLFRKLWAFQKPTPVQQQLWPALLCGRDCVAIAPTGSGKTLAYLMPAAAHAAHFGSGSVGGIGEAAMPRVLVCVPTRELAEQVVAVGSHHLKLLARARLRCVSVVGGADNRSVQVDTLLCGPPVHIVAGTCGRILDLVKLGALSLACTTFVVLDEADTMLQVGFEEQLSNIMGLVPKVRQSVLTSATFPLRLREAARSWTRPDAFTTIRVSAVVVAARKSAGEESGGARLVEVAGSPDGTIAQATAAAPRASTTVPSRAPTTVSALGAESTNTVARPAASSVVAASRTVTHRIHVIDGADRGSGSPTDRFRAKLARLDVFLAQIGERDAVSNRRQASSALIFCNKRKTVEAVHHHLEAAANATASGKKRRRGLEHNGGRPKRRISAAMLHGRLGQDKRVAALQGFRSGKFSVLVATDVGARGLDVKALQYVLNFDMPSTIETFVHRIGRTGRGGLAGVAETFIHAAGDGPALAGKLVRLLREYEQEVPPELEIMAQQAPMAANRS